MDREFKSTTMVYFMAITTFSREWDRVWIEGEECGSCATACTANTPTFANRSLEFQLALGMGSDGSAGFLQVAAKSPTGNLGNPATMRRVLRTGATSLYDQTTIALGNTPPARQILAPQVLADIVPLDAYSYEIRCYRPADKGTAGVNGLYAPLVAPFGVTKVENLDRSATTSNRVRITVTNGADVERGEFTYDAAAQGWTLRHDRRGETRIESRSSTIDSAGRRIELHKFLDGAGNVTRAVRNTYRTFPWNSGPNARNPEEMIESVVDPDGLAEKTAYAYYSDATSDGFNYGRLKSRVDPTGFWQQFEYDEAGRVAKTTTPFGHAALGATRSVRVRQTTFSFDQPQWTDVETIVQADGASVEIARGYRSSNSGIAQVIVCQTAGASAAAAENLVTTTRYINFGNFWGKVQIFVRPDGTGFINTYSTAAGRVTTTTLEGAFNAARNNILAGTRTVTVTDDKTQVVQESKFDIATGLALSTKVASQFDADGRVTRHDYNNGDSEFLAYGCCGLDYQVSRDGVRTSYTYDSWGRVRTKTSGGITERYAYDREGRRTAAYRIGSDGTELPIETSVYDAVGDVASATAFGLRTTTFAKSFDGAGRLVKTTTLADGGTRVATYARDGSLVAVGGTALAPTAYEYGVDAAGTFTREIRLGSAGEQTEWIKSYLDFAGRNYKSVFPDGATEQNYFNGLGQLVRRVDADGVSTVFAYDSLGRPEYAAVDLNRNGAIDQGGTDRITRTRREVASAHGTVVDRTTTSVWTTDNATTAPDVAVVETTFDGRNVWQTVLGLTTQVQVTVDGAGGRTETTTAPDGTTVTRRFEFDRLVSVLNARTGLGTLASTTIAYDPHGRVQTTTDSRTGATTFTYYSDDQVQTATSPDPDLARSGAGFDAQVTRYTYDAMGRVGTVTGPDGGVTTTTYYPTGQPKRTSGARTFPSEYRYDAQGRVKTLTTWQNFSSDAGKAVTTWNYDAQRGWLATKLHADGVGTAYAYTAAGRLKTRTWARGVVTTFGYDAAGANYSTTYSDGTPTVTLTFDRLGRVATKSDGTGACAYTYNGTSAQVSGEAHGAGLLAGFALNRTFDALQRLSTIAALAGPATLSQTTFGYDTASRLQQVTTGSLTATYGYGANSPLVESLTLATAGSTRLTTTKSYDRLNRLISLTHSPSGGAALSYSHAHDQGGQRVQTTREDGTAWRYGYDALGQVTSAQHRLADATPMLGQDFAYEFDDIGNRKRATTNGHTSSYVANAVNQYVQRSVPGLIDVTGSAASTATVTANLQPTQRQGETFFRAVPVDNSTAAQNPAIAIVGVKNNVGSNGESVLATETRTAFLPRNPEAFTYDPDGNLTGDGRWTYVWDAENRLIAMETHPAVATILPALKRRLEFAYDLYGRRIRKVVQNGTVTGYVMAQDRRFVYDGWNLQAEVDALSANAVVRNYCWGLDLSGSVQGAGGVGGLLGLTVAASSSYAVAHDGNGNVVALVNQADGTRAASYEYGVFGELLRADGSAADANPFGFSTKYTDAESGLVYYGYRYYQPQTGRWPSRDPIEEEGGVNLYGFVDNDPISSVDTLGLVLYAVGGTDSATDNANLNNRTNVRRFHDDFVGPGQKLYRDGPGAAMGGIVFGRGTSNLEDVGYRFICAELVKQKREQPWLADPVYLIGHSRGGLAVMGVAEKLKKGCPCADNKPEIKGPIPVQFMGLYDAVSMNMGHPSGPISDNVSFAAHGIRDSATGSRGNWGNTGESGAQLLITKRFYGNHSAMGGDPSHGDKIDSIGLKQNIVAAREIDVFIRSNARRNGALLNGK
ncbi:MAG: RHS repeat-associated core domain-containing protein [Opitutaceae bacterium]